MVIGEGGLRTGVQPLAAGREHHILQEHAEIHPATDVEPPLDGKHQSNRRIEKEKRDGKKADDDQELTVAEAASRMGMAGAAGAVDDADGKPAPRNKGVYGSGGNGGRA